MYLTCFTLADWTCAALWLAQNNPAATAPVAEKGPVAAPAPGLVDFLPLVLAMLFIFYFIIIRPQQKEERDRKQLLGGLKKNDRVATSSGILGTIIKVSEREIILKVDDEHDVRMRFLPSAILAKMNKEEPAPEEVAAAK